MSRRSVRYPERDAAKTLRDAESQADLLKARAEARLEEMQAEIDGLAAKRHEALARVESALAALRETVSLMTSLDDQDAPETSVAPGSSRALGAGSPMSDPFPSESAGFESDLESAGPSTAPLPLAMVRAQSA